MFLDTSSMLFSASIIIAGIFYGQYMYSKGLEYGTDRTLDDLENAGIIRINEDGEISAGKK